MHILSIIKSTSHILRTLIDFLWTSMSSHIRSFFEDSDSEMYWQDGDSERQPPSPSELHGSGWGALGFTFT